MNSGLNNKIAAIAKAVSFVPKAGTIKGRKIARAEDVIAAVTAETKKNSVIWQTSVQEETQFDPASGMLHVWLHFWWEDLESGEKTNPTRWLATVSPAGNHTMGMAYTYATRTWLQANLNLLMVDDPEAYESQDRPLTEEEIARVNAAMERVDKTRRKLILGAVGVNEVKELMKSQTHELAELIEAEKGQDDNS